MHRMNLCPLYDLGMTFKSMLSLDKGIIIWVYSSLELSCWWFLILQELTDMTPFYVGSQIMYKIWDEELVTYC